MEIEDKYTDRCDDDSIVEVDCSSITASDPEKQCLSNPFTFNNYSKDEIRHKPFTFKYTTRGRLIETVISVTGGLSAEYQATTGQIEGTGVSQQITEKLYVYIKPKSSRRVTVIQMRQRKECPARNIKLSFPKDAKIKCKFHVKGDSNVKVNSFPIKEILNDYVEDKNTYSGPLAVKLEGKCVWEEIDSFIDIEENEPLN